MNLSAYEMELWKWKLECLADKKVRVVATSEAHPIIGMASLCCSHHHGIPKGQQMAISRFIMCGCMAPFSIRSQDICGSAKPAGATMRATSATRSGLMSLSHITHIWSLFPRSAQWHFGYPPVPVLHQNHYLLLKHE